MYDALHKITTKYAMDLEILFRGAVHTQVTTPNVNLTLCFGPNHPSMITSSVVTNVYHRILN